MDTSDDDAENTTRQSNKRKNEDTNDTEPQKSKRTKISNLSDKDKQIRSALKKLSQSSEPNDLVINDELMININEFLDKKRVNITQNQFNSIMIRLHNYVQSLKPFPRSD
jgi:ATP-dependent 26S proteasome regulatory subunit